MNILNKQLLTRIKKFLELEIQKNKPFTSDYDIYKYHTDIKTLVHINFKLEQSRYK